MHNELRDRIHKANVEKGWWTDLETDLSIIETRNRPEILCLIASEICEAYDDPHSPDSHLSMYKTIWVEIADALIRISDLAGAEKIDLDKLAPLYSPSFFHGVGLESIFMTATSMICSDALEGYRKGKVEKYHYALQQAYAYLIGYAAFENVDIMEIIEAKIAYNANREDHKIENRKAEGGKKI